MIDSKLIVEMVGKDRQISDIQDFLSYLFQHCHNPAVTLEIMKAVSNYTQEKAGIRVDHHHSGVHGGPLYRGHRKRRNEE